MHKGRIRPSLSDLLNLQIVTHMKSAIQAVSRNNYLPNDILFLIL